MFAVMLKTARQRVEESILGPARARAEKLMIISGGARALKS